MRQVVDEDRLRSFMRRLGREAQTDCRVYFTGRASAVLMGRRPTTVDADMRVVSASDTVPRAIPRLKESLQINVELASPADFIPEIPGWEERSPFICREGKASFHHFDYYSQALAKVERRHEQDLRDVS